jgi:peptidoglycan/xylan/chitin deacetylase (PgdA/CDA1 family)
MIRNFLFHRVNPQRDNLWDPMDVKLFEKCIKYISTHYRVELFEKIVFSEEAMNSKNKYASIMFDDGYKDNIEYALPILEKYNIKASFYVVTDCINKNIPTWTHILEHLFQNTRAKNISFNFNFLPGEFLYKDFTTEQDKIDYVSKLKPLLRTISHENRQLVLNKVVESFADVELPKLMMDWNDLKQLNKLGHYIGSHTATHGMLGTMINESEIKNELLNSGKEIEKKLGYFPFTISYPVGSFNETTKRISKEVGYKIGLAVKQDIYNPKKEDLFEVARIELYNEPWWKTRLRITNSLERIKKMIGYK